jgi:hypothetical protein
MDKRNLEKLWQIREKMLKLLEEADSIMRWSADKFDHERAKAYWIGHIDSALGDGDCMDLPETLASYLKNNGIDLDTGEIIDDNSEEGLDDQEEGTPDSEDSR